MSASCAGSAGTRASKNFALVDVNPSRWQPAHDIQFLDVVVGAPFEAFARKKSVSPARRVTSTGSGSDPSSVGMGSPYISVCPIRLPLAVSKVRTRCDWSPSTKTRWPVSSSVSATG
jgi:hypothetical protein